MFFAMKAKIIFRVIGKPAFETKQNNSYTSIK